MTTDYRAMCAELVDSLHKHTSMWEGHEIDLVARARALLDQPVAKGPTDEELVEMWHSSDWFNEGATLREFISITRAILAKWGNSQGILDSSPQPVAVSERLTGAIKQVLIKAECALSDIAEGEAEENEGDPLQWVEKRAADALARIRPVMREHEIRTSEWPPFPASALPTPEAP